jgi:hypothetical protein
MKASGPHLNRQFYLEDRPRAFFSSLPIGLDANDYQFNFFEFNETLVSGQLATIKDSGATVATSGSDLVITSTATTDNDGGAVLATNLSYLVKNGKNLWFEARVKVSDADDGEMFIGLSETFATNPEAVLVAGIARVGFELVEGSAVVRMVVDNDTATTRELSGISMADDEYITLGFRTMNDQVLFYANRSLIGRMSIPTAIAAKLMGPAFFHLSGNATGTHTAHCDYIMVAQER